MFIVHRGVAIILPNENLKVKVDLYSGAFFGEYALILNEPRSSSVEAASTCEICVLHRDDFDRIIVEYPDFASTMKETVIQRKFATPGTTITQDIKKQMQKMDNKIERQFDAKRNLWGKVRPLI